MLAAHEPNLDPRINWEAESASEKYDVTVMGLQNLSELKPQEETINNYKVFRFNRNELDKKSNFCLMIMQHLIPRRLQIAGSVATALLLPFYFILEIIFNLIRVLLFTSARLLFADLRSFKLIKYSVKYILSKTGILNSIRRYYDFIWITKHFFATSMVFWRELCRMRSKPHIIHCNDLDTLLVGVLAKKVYNCGLVYDAHEFWPYSDVNAPWYQVAISKFYEKWLIRHVDYAITVNPMLARLIGETYGLPKVYSLPNCEPWRKPSSAVVRGKMSELADGRVKFLYQGNFAPKRGLEEIIQAWKHVDGSKAVLFLRGPDNIYKEECFKVANATGRLGESIFFLEAVAEKDLIDAAMEADVGIIPYKPVCINYTYCCPNKLSQYMHAGLIIMANRLPYVEEVLNKYSCGVLYDSDDINSIVDAIADIINKPGYRAGKKENSLKFAGEEFNWQVQSSILFEIYGKLTSCS